MGVTITIPSTRRLVAAVKFGVAFRGTVVVAAKWPREPRRRPTVTWIELIVPVGLAILLAIHFLAVAWAANEEDYEEPDSTNDKR